MGHPTIFLGNMIIGLVYFVLDKSSARQYINSYEYGNETRETGP